MSGHEPTDPMLEIARRAVRHRSVFSVILVLGLLVLFGVVLFIVIGG